MNVFTVITVFPELISDFAGVGIVRRAQERGIVSVDAIDLRAFAPRGNGRIDDAPYGGGPGMLMSVAPLRASIAQAKSRIVTETKVAYLTPQGRCLDQRLVHELTACEHLVLVAGRYEGIDERIIERDIDIEISLGDFVLSGGEIAAMAVIDAIVRTLPGTLGSERSALGDSFVDDLLEYPQYTRPEEIDGQVVPQVLLSGNHAEIAQWRRQQALGRTWLKRPELLERRVLEADDQRLLDAFIADRNLGKG